MYFIHSVRVKRPYGERRNPCDKKWEGRGVCQVRQVLLGEFVSGVPGETEMPPSFLGTEEGG